MIHLECKAMGTDLGRQLDGVETVQRMIRRGRELLDDLRVSYDI